MAGIRDLPVKAKALAKAGRFGDTMLAHINPQEAALLKAHGGSGTINPKTGLPEFFFGDDYGFGGQYGPGTAYSDPSYNNGGWGSGGPSGYGENYTGPVQQVNSNGVINNYQNGQLVGVYDPTGLAGGSWGNQGVMAKDPYQEWLEMMTPKAPAPAPAPAPVAPPPAPVAPPAPAPTPVVVAQPSYSYSNPINWENNPAASMSRTGIPEMYGPQLGTIGTTSWGPQAQPQANPSFDTAPSLDYYDSLSGLAAAQVAAELRDRQFDMPEPGFSGNAGRVQEEANNDARNASYGSGRSTSADPEDPYGDAYSGPPDFSYDHSYAPSAMSYDFGGSMESGISGMDAFSKEQAYRDLFESDFNNEPTYREAGDEQRDAYGDGSGFPEDTATGDTWSLGGTAYTDEQTATGYTWNGGYPDEQTATGDAWDPAGRPQYDPDFRLNDEDPAGQRQVEYAQNYDPEFNIQDAPRYDAPQGIPSLASMPGMLNAGWAGVQQPSTGLSNMPNFGGIPSISAAHLASAGRTAPKFDEYFSQQAAINNQNNVGKRQNNPGNLRPASWMEDFPGYMGAIKGKNGSFANFATPTAGLKAASQLLDNYNAKGRNTVQSIVTAWAPPTENNTKAYIDRVSKQLGVSPTQPLDMNNIDVKAGMLSAKIAVELGFNVSPEMVKEALLGGQVTLDQNIGSVAGLAGMSGLTGSTGQNSMIGGTPRGVDARPKEMPAEVAGPRDLQDMGSTSYQGNAPAGFMDKAFSANGITRGVLGVGASLLGGIPGTLANQAGRLGPDGQPISGTIADALFDKPMGLQDQKRGYTSVAPGAIPSMALAEMGLDYRNAGSAYDLKTNPNAVPGYVGMPQNSIYGSMIPVGDNLAYANSTNSSGVYADPSGNWTGPTTDGYRAASNEGNSYGGSREGNQQLQGQGIAPSTAPAAATPAPVAPGGGTPTLDGPPAAKPIPGAPANWDEAGYLAANPKVAAAVASGIYSSGFEFEMAFKATTGMSYAEAVSRGDQQALAMGDRILGTRAGQIMSAPQKEIPEPYKSMGIQSLYGMGPAHNFFPNSSGRRLATGGIVKGAGTETSDSIPAIIDGKEPAALSDGEFVFTGQAVRGAGGGDRMQGAKNLYQLMHQFEQQAPKRN